MFCDRHPEFVIDRERMQQDSRRPGARYIIKNIGVITDDFLHSEIIKKLYSAEGFNQLPIWRLTRSVPEVQYFHDMDALLDLVVHHNWTVHQPSHLATITDWGPYSRVVSQQLEIIKKRMPKARSCGRIILGNVSDDLREIV